jgi:transcription-repair coupling factor (superfamily II helicase)
LVPHDFSPAADVRLAIYRRLARTRSMGALEDLAEELADRFGSLPKPLLRLLDVARLRLLSVQNGLAAVHAGPYGIAVTGHDGATAGDVDVTVCATQRYLSAG